MKKARNRAVVYMAACALYIYSAELMWNLGIGFGAVVALMMSMVCVSNSFICGMEYERSLWEEEKVFRWWQERKEADGERPMP